MDISKENFLFIKSIRYFFLMLVSFFFLAFRHSSYYYERIGRKTCEKKEKKKVQIKKTFSSARARTMVRSVTG